LTFGLVDASDRSIQLLLRWLQLRSERLFVEHLCSKLKLSDALPSLDKYQEILPIEVIIGHARLPAAPAFLLYVNEKPVIALNSGHSEEIRNYSGCLLLSSLMLFGKSGMDRAYFFKNKKDNSFPHSFPASYPDVEISDMHLCSRTLADELMAPTFLLSKIVEAHAGDWKAMASAFNIREDLAINNEIKTFPLRQDLQDLFKISEKDLVSKLRAQITRYINPLLTR